MVNVVNELDLLISKETYSNDTIQNIKKDFTWIAREIEKFIKTLNYFISEDAPNVLRKDFLHKWNFLKVNLSYLYKTFNNIDKYWKAINDLFKKLLQ